MQRILLVDDEQNVLNALRRELEGDYEVETFASPLGALHRTRETDFALVIADYRMPEMDGVTFLENFGQMQPDAVRLILSGQADRDALIKAVNLTHIYSFISKPWDEVDLKADIRLGLNYREAILENRRFAETYRQRFGTLPQERVRKLYRVLLLCQDVHAATAMRRELTQVSGHETLYGAMRYEMTHKPHHGGHDFQMEVDNGSASPQEEMERLVNNAYDLVIADSSVPEMKGMAFFRKLREAGVDSAFILVGEGLDMATLIEAINQVHIDDFLKRNWNGHELKSAVMRALRHRDLLTENRAMADRLREQAK